MKDENKKEDLSIPVFTKPVAKDGVVDEASVPAPVKVEVPTTPVNTEVGTDFTPPPQVPIASEVNTEPVHENSLPNKHVLENNDKIAPGVSGKLSLQQIAEGQTTPPMDVNPYASLNNNDDIYDDEYYLRVFIGKNYDKFRSGRFNFAFFFFGNLYLFYRKMILKGVIFSLFFTIIGPLAEYYTGVQGLNFGLLVFITIAYSFMINRSYYSFAQKKVQNIQYSNMNKSGEEIEKICKKSGGRSLLYILLGLLVAAAISTAISFVLNLIGLAILFKAIIG